MRTLPYLLTFGALLCPVAAAEPVLRLSSGMVHSGTLEIELDVSGAGEVVVLAKPDEPVPAGPGAQVTWLETTFLDAFGQALPPAEPSAAPAGALRFQLAGKAASRLRLRVKIEQRGESGTTQIQISHDGGRALPPAPGAKGNTGRGRNVFARGTCSSCHVLGGRGGRVGPDLSALGKRSSLEQIIESITVPDAAIAPGFETNIIETKDGTPNLGFVIADSAEQTVVKDTAGQSHTLKKSDIVTRKPQSYSLMPAFAELLSAQDIADLAAFLHAQRE